MSFKGMMMKAGIFPSPEVFSLKGGIKILDVLSLSETGYDNAIVLQHGTDTTALAYGTQTDHLVMRSLNFTVAVTGKYVLGDVIKITTSAVSTGHIYARKTLVYVGHNTGAVRCNYNEIDITGTAVLNSNIETIKAEVDIEAGAITGTGKITGVAVVMVALPAVTSIANHIYGIEVDMRNVRVDTTPGEVVGIKVTMAGGASPPGQNYLDYGLQFSNCFNTATAVINFDLTQGNTAGVLLVESGAFTITNFIEITGTVTNFAKLTAGVSGTHCFFANALAIDVATSHALQIMVGTTPHYIPVFSDLSWNG